MPEQYLSPHQAAAQLGVSVHTVRRWCEDHAAYLSPTASPAKGATRRLTVRDVEVLQEVARYRNTEGLTTAQINERLAGVVFPDATDLQPTRTATDGPGTAIAPIVVLEALERVQARMDAIESQRPTWRDVIFFVLVAFIAGLIVASAWAWFR